jgi:hypothetical protein
LGRTSALEPDGHDELCVEAFRYHHEADRSGNIDLLHEKLRPVPLPLTDEYKAHIDGMLQYATKLFRDMDLTAAENRLVRITQSIKIGTSFQAMFNELKVLKESVEDDITYERFYHYPKKVAEIPIRVAADWAATLAAFPSAEMRFEIESGVDCFALGHHTAAIFHFMRVVEYGLRATAKKLRARLPKNKRIEWSEWQVVLTAMEKKVEIAKQSVRGKKKAAELDFYSGALSHFAGFKDMYRDSVMHVRREYADWEAEMAMRNVRDFMNKLSTRVRR